MNARPTKTATRPPARPGPFKPTPAKSAPGRNGTPAGRAKRSAQQPASGEAPAVRVDAAGLVHAADSETVEKLPLYYHAERSKWYGPNSQAGFSHLTEGQARSLIAEHGFNRRNQDEQGNTKADRAMLWLIQRRAVAYAGPLAGYPAGSHEVEGVRLLATESPRLVEPRPGDWPTIRRLVETLYADPARDQVPIFYFWAAEAFAAFWQRMTAPGPWPFRYCPALAMFGPRHCGKTALIELVLTPLFGGRKADPMNYLRDPKFNKDLFAASLLVLDDKGASANLAERRQRGEAIKDLIWKEEQRMEGKGQDALMLRPFWRLVIAGNDDDAGLQVCPALSPSLEDKLILLRANRAEGLPTTHDENSAWVAAIRRELSAFAAFLLGWRPPAALTPDPRTRVANFWHPELVARLRDMQPEMRLLELIDGFGISGPDGGPWEGSASEFERAMLAKDTNRVLDRVFVTSQSAGRLLSELERVTPNRVEKKNHSGTMHYRIFPPKPADAPEQPA